MRILRVRRSDAARVREQLADMDKATVIALEVPGFREAMEHVSGGGRVYVDIVDSEPLGLMPDGWPYSDEVARSRSVARVMAAPSEEAIAVGATISPGKDGSGGGGSKGGEGVSARRSVTVKASSLAAKARRRSTG